MITGSRFSIQSEVTRQQSLSSEIAQIQLSISTGVKINTASDDPVAMRRVAQIRATQASQTTWGSNVTIATQVASQVEDSLASVTTQLTRAKELMLKAGTDTAGTSDRNAVATELTGISTELDTLSKTTDFTGTPLFATTGTNPVAIPVGPDVAIAASDSYDRVFGSVTLADGTTKSVAQVLASAIAAAKSGDRTAMTAASAAIDAAQSHISVMTTDAGTRAQRISAASDRLDASKIDLEDERSSLQDTDITAASAQLMQKKTQLDAAQLVLSQLQRNTLFDKLA